LSPTLLGRQVPDLPAEVFFNEWEVRALEAIGVEPVRAPLSAPDSGGRYDGVRLVEALLSLA